MQVYKLFMILISRNKKALLIYIGIFLGIVVLLSGQAKKNEDSGYVNVACNFAVFDYDQSEASKLLLDYLKEKNECVEIKKDDDELIQDELYNRVIDCVVRIPKGFEESLGSENENDIIDLVGIVGTNKYSSFERQLENYLKLVKSYIASGLSITEACNNAKETSALETNVKMIKNEEKKSFSLVYYFFALSFYPFIGIVFDGVGKILLIVKKKEIKNRIECSSFKFSTYNVQLFFGSISVGVLVCVFFGIASVIIAGNHLFTVTGALYMLLMISLMMAVLGMAFVITNLVKDINALTMMANIIGLGICFLSGVFVPMEYLSDGVLKVASFLPGYWYILGCREIEIYTSTSQLSKIFSYVGIELLFAIGFIGIGLAISRLKYQKN